MGFTMKTGDLMVIQWDLMNKNDDFMGFMEIVWEYDGRISPIICDMVFHNPLVDDF